MNTKTITIDTGRDAGKTFEITEMPVSRLEKWAARALVALMGQAMPPEMAQAARQSGAVALASLGAKGLANALAGLDWEKVEPLYDDLLGQIAVVTDQGVRVPLKAGNIELHIRDVGTIFRMRYEAVAVNFDFFPDVSVLTSPHLLRGAPSD